MTEPMREKARSRPHVVATGFTTAFLGDERTLREFIIGDHERATLVAGGENAVLYLINDSLDPLNERQLRIGVDKEAKLERAFARYCGQPIAFIPDPFECHESYSAHFADALMARLRALDIHPVMLDSHLAYRAGHYDRYVQTTFENYQRIREVLAASFESYTMKNLFRAQCSRCARIDATNIENVRGRDVRVKCESCGHAAVESTDSIRGKLNWKLDCAARWNIYAIDTETFSKDHVSKLGTFEISKFMSEHYYGGVVPRVARYGEVKIERALSNRLIEVVPPAVLKAMFLANPGRDLELNHDYVVNFCAKHEVRPGLSYVDFVRTVLPLEAIATGVPASIAPVAGAAVRGGTPARTDSLLAFGARYARLFHGKETGLRPLALGEFARSDDATRAVALELVDHAFLVRTCGAIQSDEKRAAIRSYVRSRGPAPEVYHYLRRVCGQTAGPNIGTLLSLLPLDYLETLRLILSLLVRDPAGANATGGEAIAPELIALDLVPPIEEDSHPERSRSTILRAASNPSPVPLGGTP